MSYHDYTNDVWVKTVHWSLADGVGRVGTPEIVQEMTLSSCLCFCKTSVFL